MTKSSEDIEREVEAARGDLDRTVEALKDKMSPGQLIDELTRSFKGGGAGDVMSNLGAQVRENPMALAMIGAGMAWLMTGKAGAAAPDTLARNAPAQGADASSILGGVAEKIGDQFSAAGDKAQDALGGAAHQAGQGLHELGSQAAGAGRKARSAVEDIVHREPLILGALGLAVGAALGAALPATAAEDRAFGAARDDLVEAGERKLAQSATQLRAAGAAAVDAVKEEAAQQGLAAEGELGLVEKAEAVLRSGAAAARDELSGGTH